MKDYDTYLFDWDGTIVNSSDIWVTVMHENLQAYGLTLSRDVLLQCMGDWRDLVTHGLPEEHFDAYHAKTGHEAHARLSEARLYEGVHELLHGLRRRGKKMGIVTASSRPIIEVMLERHDLRQIFDVIVSGSDTKKHKPDPEGVLLALRKLGVADKAQAVMIGDTTRDLLAAQAAGIDDVLFLPANGHFALEKLAAICSPTYVVRHWAEFAPHIER